MFHSTFDCFLSSVLLYLQSFYLRFYPMSDGAGPVFYRCGEKRGYSSVHKRKIFYSVQEGCKMIQCVGEKRKCPLVGEEKKGPNVREEKRMAQCAGERTDCPSVREGMKNGTVCRREDGLSQCARENEE
jgi:hypothetical protein